MTKTCCAASMVFLCCCMYGAKTAEQDGPNGVCFDQTCVQVTFEEIEGSGRFVDCDSYVWFPVKLAIDRDSYIYGIINIIYY